MLRSRHPTAHVIENAENVGFARGNNQALRRAVGRYLLLLNPDTVISGPTVAPLVREMDRHPEAAVGSPMLLNGDRTPQHCWARFPSLVSELLGDDDRSQSPYPLDDFADATKRQAMVPFPVDWVGGACFMVRASAMHEVGLLDEAFFMYCEETEWCHRFGRAGWHTLLIPAVEVIHLGGQSSQAVPVATRRHLFRSRVRLYWTIYGGAWGTLLSSVATGRFLLFNLRRRLQTAVRRRDSARR
jgi:GT2 family glycosyltransferase